MDHKPDENTQSRGPGDKQNATGTQTLIKGKLKDRGGEHSGPDAHWICSQRVSFLKHTKG